jgi:hypothetical protein
LRLVVAKLLNHADHEVTAIYDRTATTETSARRSPDGTRD